MLKIGFIDYYLDEWHANNYPAWIREASGGEVEVAYAFGEIDSPKGGLTTEKWCETMGVQHCRTIEELIEKSDALIVLSPDNCERHEALCRLPLRSGKRTYVDKTFAPDYAAARRIFDMAEAGKTSCWSTSALRFAEEYAAVDKQGISAVNSWGPGDFETYVIHQLEPMMMLIGAPAKRVMALAREAWYTLVVEFADGRTGTISGFEKGSPFRMHFARSTENTQVTVASDFFQAFIRELVRYFRTGVIPVPHEETLAIMAARGAGLEAMKTPGQWVPVVSF